MTQAPTALGAHHTEPLWPGVFADALRTGTGAVHGMTAAAFELPLHTWRSVADESDRMVLTHCVDPCLDIGCGPGRMTQALTAAGVRVLGVDVVQEAVDQARRRGAPAITADVFEPLPGEGRWACALLADGNIGIGGNPDLLLRRVHALLNVHGRVVVDLAQPGVGLRTRYVRIESNDVSSAPFRWALVGPEAIRELALVAGYASVVLHEYGGRWFAVLDKDRT